MKYFLLTMLFIFVGCSTCPPCVPTHEVVDNTLPMYDCPAPPELPDLILPSWPVLADDADEQQRKQWYVDMAQTVNALIDILKSRVSDLEAMLDAYRKPVE